MNATHARMLFEYCIVSHAREWDVRDVTRYDRIAAIHDSSFPDHLCPRCHSDNSNVVNTTMTSTEDVNVRTQCTCTSQKEQNQQENTNLHETSALSLLTLFAEIGGVRSQQTKHEITVETQHTHKTARWRMWRWVNVPTSTTRIVHTQNDEPDTK